MKHYLGVDIGTTSTKVCAFDESGHLVNAWTNHYPLYHPEVGAAVQDIDEVFWAVEAGIKTAVEALGANIAAMGLSVAMHSLILLDENKTPLTPIITWADTRASIDAFSDQQRATFLKRTGTPVHPMSPLVKLGFLAKTDPLLWSRSYYVSDLKSLLIDRFTTNGLLLDTNLASATGLLNLKLLNWDTEALMFAGISEKQLPTVVPPTTRLNWRPSIADQLGFKRFIPFFIGGSDGCMANLGSGIWETSKVAISVGTSGALRTTHKTKEIDPDLGLFNYHLIDEFYVMGGASNNGGKLLEWLFDFFKGHFTSIADMTAAADKVACDGLSFVPYLFGERAPIYDAGASASFFGMRGHHTPAQYVRAVIEGITENLLQILQKVEIAAGQQPAKVLASGGFTQADWWVTLFSARSGRQFEIAQTAQASAYGAALIARIGLGEISIADLTN